MPLVGHEVLNINVYFCTSAYTIQNTSIVPPPKKKYEEIKKKNKKTQKRQITANVPSLASYTVVN